MTTTPTYQFLALRSGRSDRTNMIYPLDVIRKVCNDINSKPRMIYLTNSRPDVDRIMHEECIYVDLATVIGQVTDAEVVHGNLFVTIVQQATPTAQYFGLNLITSIAAAGIGNVGLSNVVGDDYVLSHFYVYEMTSETQEVTK